MKYWYTCGSLGSTVYELNFFDIIKLLLGKEFKCNSIVLSFGKSKRKTFNGTPIERYKPSLDWK